MKFRSLSSQNRLLVSVLLFLGLLRLFSLALYPLADTTEARYAEIARLMVSSGNWITPQIDAGVPFWGKPPLSTWLSAISFQLFGINEFAARLPSFLLGVVIVGLIYTWAKQLRGRTYALAAATVLTTSAVFFISCGAVMTDPALLLGTTLSMVAFYRAMTAHETLWGYLFFVGLAISLLAKGPVGLVLTLVPVGSWVLWNRRSKDCWFKLPWLKGLLLTAALSVPWYLLAEHETPGFLEYFLVGEHWKRFLEPGWEGDLYGSAHSRPIGTIWGFWLVSVLPWTPIVIGTILAPTYRRQAVMVLKKNRSLSSYLLLWCLTPMIFFTLAGNILYTYVLPGIPAFSMLVAKLWNASENSTPSLRFNRPAIFAHSATCMAFLFTLALLIITSNLVPKRKCQKDIVEIYNSFRQPNAQIVYLFDRPHSAQFYSRGAALLIEDPQVAEILLKDKYESFFVLRSKHVSRLNDRFLSQLDNLGEQNGYTLFRERSASLAGI